MIGSHAQPLPSPISDSFDSVTGLSRFVRTFPARYFADLFRPFNPLRHSPADLFPPIELSTFAGDSFFDAEGLIEHIVAAYAEFWRRLFNDQD
jgi:hypothetical protein